jgi:hypothetical protein
MPGTKLSASLLVTACLLLPTFLAFFKWGFCDGRSCSNEWFASMQPIHYNCIICVTVFCAAEFAKSLLVQILASNFFK